MMTVSVSAQSESDQKAVQTQTKGVHANANWLMPYYYGNKITILDVLNTNDGITQIRLSIQYYDVFGNNHRYDGTFSTTDKVFKNHGLNSASLSDVPISVQDFYTGDIKTVTVQADWTTIGGIVTATGSIQDGNNVDDLGTSYAASLVKFKS
jgi:hypothetical protein